MTSASWTESPADVISTVRCAYVLADSSRDLYGCAREDGVDRSIGREVLAVTAPADSRHDWFGGEAVADVSAEATSGAFKHSRIS